MVTSPDACFIFSKFLFFGLLGGETKIGQNGKKKIVSLDISGIAAHMIVVFGTHV